VIEGDVLGLRLTLVPGHVCVSEIEYLVGNGPASCVAHLLEWHMRVERDKV
jgi:hypothetical protein